MARSPSNLSIRCSSPMAVGHLSAWMRAPLERLTALGGSAFALIHDILPLQRPDLFHDHVSQSISDWLT